MDDWGAAALQAIVRRLIAEQEAAFSPLLPVTFALHPDTDFDRPPAFQVELCSSGHGGVVLEQRTPLSLNAQERRLSFSTPALRAIVVDRANPQALAQSGEIRVSGSASAFPVWNAFFDASSRLRIDEIGGIANL